MGFRAKNSKGVDKHGAKCNMGFGRITKSYPVVFCAASGAEGRPG